MPDYGRQHTTTWAMPQRPGESGRSDRLLPPGAGTRSRTMPKHTYNLGNAFYGQGKLDEAMACYRRALELKPDFAEAHIQPGQCTCTAKGSWTKRSPATAGSGTQAGLCRGTLQPGRCAPRSREAGRGGRLLPPGTGTQPDLAEIHNNLGNDLQAQGKLDEAVACFRRALELKPDFSSAHNNLGNIELDYVHRWRRAGGSLHRYNHIQDFDVYLNIDGWFDFQDILRYCRRRGSVRRRICRSGVLGRALDGLLRFARCDGAKAGFDLRH